ncbi:MAG: ParB/RepB/Spo0J family partition protein [Candidatus Bathyarchaeia archaeon]
MSVLTERTDGIIRSEELEIEALLMPALALRPIDERIVAELTRSIESSGLLQPIVVRECRGGYEVVFGRHRIEAIKRLGLKSISAAITKMSSAEAFLARVTENLIRNTYVNPVEEARGYQTLVRSGWTINAIARRIGKCDSYVSERLSLLRNIDPKLLSRITDGSSGLTPSHAELLSRIKDPVKQTEVAEFIEKKRFSVRVLEDLLNGVPLPLKVKVEQSTQGCFVRIPTEYMDAVQLTAGMYSILYVRGKKLILENMHPERRNRKKKAANLSTLFEQYSSTSPSAGFRTCEVS